MTEKKLDHGYTGSSKYRIEVFANVTGELIATFKHVYRSSVQDFMQALDEKPDHAFKDCAIFIHRELVEKGELDD